MGLNEYYANLDKFELLGCQILTYNISKRKHIEVDSKYSSITKNFKKKKQTNQQHLIVFLQQNSMELQHLPNNNI